MKKFILYSLLLAFTVESQAQITLREFDDPNKPGYEKIIFESRNNQSQANQGGASTNTRKEFDIQENNPFAKRQFDGRQRNAGYNKFNMAEVNSEDFFQANFPNKINSENARSIKLKSALAKSDVAQSNKSVIVTYDINFYEENGSKVSTKSSGYLFDQFGELKYTLPESDQGYYSPQVTPKRDFLVYRYGELSSHGTHNVLRTPGVIIKKLSNDKNILEFKSDQDKTVHEPALSDDLIVIVEQGRDNTYTYNVFNSKTGFLYKTNLTASEIGQMKEMNSAGFVFRSGRVMTYSNDFESQKID